MRKEREGEGGRKGDIGSHVFTWFHVLGMSFPSGDGLIM